MTGTQISYYHTCLRKLWLFSNHIKMEHNSNAVLEGKFIHQTSYHQRADRYREVAIDGIKIDYYDPTHKLVREVKKSDKLEEAHLAQLKYYLFVLEKNGVTGVSGILEYPKLKKTRAVELTEADRSAIPRDIERIQAIVSQSFCPPSLKKPYCRRCAYYEFCYSGE